MKLSLGLLLPSFILSLLLLSAGTICGQPSPVVAISPVPGIDYVWLLHASPHSIKKYKHLKYSTERGLGLGVLNRGRKRWHKILHNDSLDLSFDFSPRGFPPFRKMKLQAIEIKTKGVATSNGIRIGYSSKRDVIQSMGALETGADDYYLYKDNGIGVGFDENGIVVTIDLFP